MPDLTCLSPSCLQRAAADPDAPPELSERLQRMVEIARAVADSTRSNEEEETRGN